MLQEKQLRLLAYKHLVYYELWGKKNINICLYYLHLIIIKPPLHTLDATLE